MGDFLTSTIKIHSHKELHIISLHFSFHFSVLCRQKCFPLPSLVQASSVTSRRLLTNLVTGKTLQVLNFTFMLPCIVIEFFLNNQPDALIIQILFCYKTLHVSGIFSAHHQDFCTVHSALVSFMQVVVTASNQSQDGTVFHPDSDWKRSTKTCMKLTSAECTVENS